jgi:hypothetical protein
VEGLADCKCVHDLAVQQTLEELLEEVIEGEDANLLTHHENDAGAHSTIREAISETCKPNFMRLLHRVKEPLE